MFIVNSPWIFKQVWNFVSPMMDERTRNKTKILEAKEFIPAITEVVDLESILELLGGKDTSCDFVHEQAAQLPRCSRREAPRVYLGGVCVPSSALIKLATRLFSRRFGVARCVRTGGARVQAAVARLVVAG